jgi:hypothetical protein
MTTLPSQQPILSKTQSESTRIPILRDNATYPAFRKAIINHCHLNHGQIGQNVKEGKRTITLPPRDKPHYNSKRMHPRTGQPIDNTREYQREDPPEQKSGDSPFDLDILPLTESGQRKLNADLADWKQEEATREKKQATNKGHDDDLIRVIHDHIGREAMNQITITPEHSKWRMLNFECIDRSVDFISMLDILFSKGNSAESVDQANILFNLHQAIDQSNPSAFFNEVNDQVLVVTALLQSQEHPGFISINRLHSMVLTKGLNKSSSANREGIKIHIQNHPNDALDLPNELISQVLKAHQSDLNSDKVSEQSSAFAAKLRNPSSTKAAASSWVHHEDKYPFSEIPGLVHCTNCYSLSKGKYFYSHPVERCKRTAATEKARLAKIAASKMHAKVAAVVEDTKMTSGDPTPPPSLTKAACLAFLNYNINSSDLPSLNRRQCFSFLVDNHPEELELN